MRPFAIVLGVLFVATAAFAAEERVIVLNPHVSYRDLHVACENGPSSPRLFLTLQRDAGRIVSANLKRAGLSGFGPALELTAEELSGLTLIVEGDEARLDRLTVGDRLLLWILANADADCRRAPAATIRPVPFTFVFASAPTAMMPPNASSQLAQFQGETGGKGPFSVRIRLYQRAFPL